MSETASATRLAFFLSYYQAGDSFYSHSSFCIILKYISVLVAFHRNATLFVSVHVRARKWLRYIFRHLLLSSDTT